ncbi:P-loop containing nucleoside triphosphate hydrolase protein [Mycena chlorophos]|uniref:P-loop containing nucleoside triphosphate hydrolase protein n=1 Tax=Mycena chlorophos TaxID=658473 RepID=A0A8H6WE73_MYCCL|nr:P-loop containing nucleoside triphosphate hydrolase protein [Mycena chlorophos]
MRTTAFIPATMSVSARHVSFTHRDASQPALQDVSFDLAPGTRTVIIGPNGAGKSSLLALLAGKRLISNADLRINGHDVFRNTAGTGATYLGTEWAMNPVVRGDIVVSAFLDSVGGYRHKERRDTLLDILDVDLTWRMNCVSDGERRRIQLVFGLMVPYDVLLLDEVTVDLDVLVRDDLLKFLKADSEARGATILYATHIFDDGLNFFPTHIAHMSFGRLVSPPTQWPLEPNSELGLKFGSASLYQVALQWLKEDREYRRELEATGLKLRGARRDQTVPDDSETFYRKYDYSH